MDPVKRAWKVAEFFELMKNPDARIGIYKLKVGTFFAVSLKLTYLRIYQLIILRSVGLSASGRLSEHVLEIIRQFYTQYTSAMPKLGPR